MKPFEIFSFASKQTELYNIVKLKICKRYDIGQTAFDIVMFLFNNPKYNTAKDICRQRGIKSGIVSVELEKLVKNSYVIKKHDEIDRRKQRLFLTEKTVEITADGAKMQAEFHEQLMDGLEEEEIRVYERAVGKIFDNIKRIEREGIDSE